jgi:N-carbamoyl-L-amino-acid hydrolase
MVEEQVAVIAAAGGVECRAERALDIPVVEFDPGCRDAVGRACADLGLSSMPLISGAGHDAMAIARIAPAALVFIPCRDGVSHHPAEYASPGQVGAGCDALLHAVLERSGAV